MSIDLDGCIQRARGFLEVGLLRALHDLVNVVDEGKFPRVLLSDLVVGTQFESELL